MSIRNRPPSNPNLSVTPPPQNNPSALVSVNFSLMEERWSNAHKGFTTTHYKRFVEKIKMINRMTWANALAPGDTGGRFKKISNLTFTGNITIPVKFKNEDSMLFFRYYDKRPLIGYRENDIYYVIWIESFTGDIYDHGS